MNVRILDLRPPRIAFFLLLLAGITSCLFPVKWASWPIPAGLLAVTGFGLMMGGWWQFRQRRVEICPTARTSQLVIDGLYRFSRNPMYLGIILMMFAVALLMGHPSFYAATLLYWHLMDQYFCRYEEDKLVELFAEEYERYLVTVRRWI
jgi:protein-S-isoprenylcysteine O-methyltransferase Ste14